VENAGNATKVTEGVFRCTQNAKDKARKSFTSMQGSLNASIVELQSAATVMKDELATVSSQRDALQRKLRTYEGSPTTEQRIATLTADVRPASVGLWHVRVHVCVCVVLGCVVMTVPFATPGDSS